MARGSTRLIQIDSMAQEIAERDHQKGRDRASWTAQNSRAAHRNAGHQRQPDLKAGS